MKDYIEQVIRTESNELDDICDRMVNVPREVHAIMGLISEVGELTDQFKKHIFYGQPLDNTNVYEEVGDILWYLAIMLDTMETTFEECMRANIRKLKARYPEQFDGHAAVNRNTATERAQLEDV